MAEEFAPSVAEEVAQQPSRSRPNLVSRRSLRDLLDHRWLAVAVIGLLLALTACGGTSSSGATAAKLHSEPVDPPFQVASTSLTDTDGQPFSLTKSTDHEVTLVFFGYTHCPDICGLVMSNLAAAMTRLAAADAKQVQVVFVTTDPDRDTTTVLRRYLDHYNPAFVGLTGPIQSIVDLGKSVAVGMGSPLPNGGYDVNAHSTQVTLVRHGGQAPMYWHQETTAAQYAADIHTLLNQS